MTENLANNNKYSATKSGVFEHLFFYGGKKAFPSTFITILVGALCLAIWIFHMYSAYYGLSEVYFHRFIHLSLFLILLYFSSFRKNVLEKRIFRALLLDALPAGAAIYLLVYFLIDPTALVDRGFLMDLSGWDYFFAVTLILLVLEGCRRTIGYSLLFLTLFFIVHTIYGDAFPGFIRGQGSSVPRLLAMLTMLPQDGIFGIALEIMSTYVILFIFFGSFLVKSGVSDVFINGAFALTGKKIAGPAKASVFTSALFGTVSGSAIANVNVDGVFTIPLMKRTGFSAETASAIEAVTSTGGQIMPPVMAAAAFLMAGFLGVPYYSVAAMAAIPACLYFLAVYFMVHFEGKKLGLVPLEGQEFPKFINVLKKDGYLLIPLAIIIYGLVMGYTVMYVVFWAIVVTFFLSFFHKKGSFEPVKFLMAVEDGVQECIMLVMAFACAGIIIGCVSTSGLGLSFSSMLIVLAGGKLIVALILTMLAAFILGMGLGPATVYVVLISLVVPALVKLGCNEFAAHFFVFYFGCFAVITPPVCLATYAAAGIGHANPWKAGWEGVRIGIAAYIIPFMLVYGPQLILIGSWVEIIPAILTAILGIFLLAASIQGWFIMRIGYFTRIILFASSLLLIKPGIYSDIVGSLIFLAVLIIQEIKKKTLARQSF
jgi:TRAP transporter 4TM/12TM fusion protein